MKSAALPEHIRTLLRPDAYPHCPSSVELVQTHISYALLAGEEVFKFKKPVKFPFLAFSSLEARRRDCEAEVALNRRACTDVYLGLVMVTQSQQGYEWDGEGEVVDYAVRMRRLPADRLMDQLLEANAVTPQMIESLVGRLSRFHEQVGVEDEQAHAGGFLALDRNWRRNLEEISAFTGRTLSPTRLRRLTAFAEAQLKQQESILRKRELEGRIRDCHGDLRSDAICFRGDSATDICLFDCLEFDEQLRISDVALEFGFLAMDLDFRGHSDLADLLTGLYASATSDAALTLLAPHLRSYRACGRGLVESLTSEDQEVSPQDRGAARRRAKDYFALAESYSKARSKAAVVLVMGSSGSGKSFLAGSIASRTGVALLSTDLVRQQVYGSRPEGEERDPIGRGRYAAESRDQIYERLAEECGRRLAAGQAVVLDGSYIERRHRETIVELASSRRVPFLLVECRVDEETIRQRQAQRMRQGWSPSEGRWEVYRSQVAAYQSPDELPAAARITIDTALPLDQQIASLLAALQSARSASSAR